MRYLSFCIFLFWASISFAQSANINYFDVKEDVVNTGKLTVIATDSLQHPQENINGIYTFSISGFTEVLSFNEGAALLPFKIDKSTFVYLKHENDQGTHSKLIYVFKKNDRLSPITISRIFLILIPLLLIVLAFVFKRFIYIALILFLIFLYFNHSNGLRVGTFFETTFDYLKNLV